MSRATLILASDAIREKAHAWIDKAPRLTRVTFQGPRRSIPANDKMWAMLTEISQQVTHSGIKLSPDDWKLLMLDALKREVRIVPNLDGNGLVSLGRSSSDLSAEEFASLIEVISAYGASHGVTFGETT